MTSSIFDLPPPKPNYGLRAIVALLVLAPTGFVGAYAYSNWSRITNQQPQQQAAWASPPEEPAPAPVADVSVPLPDPAPVVLPENPPAPVAAPLMAAVETLKAVEETIKVPPMPPAINQRHLQRAEKLIKDKDILSARLLLDHAVNAGDWRATELLARTYDPKFLSSDPFTSRLANQAKAEALYERAKALAAKEVKP